MEKGTDSSPCNLLAANESILSQSPRGQGDVFNTTGGLAGRLRSNLRQMQVNKIMDVEALDTHDPNEEEECNFSLEGLQEHAKSMQASKAFHIGFLVVMCVFIISCLLWDPNKN